MYGLIDGMTNSLEDFRTDWRRNPAEALLDVSIGEHSIYRYNRRCPCKYYRLIPAREKWPFALLSNPCCSTA